jgi:regulator of cell morphogenesis and NO signaling
MDKKEEYRETDKKLDLISNNYSMLLVTSRFGIEPGFDEKTIGEVCRQNKVDCCTFLTVVNFLIRKRNMPVENINNCISLEHLIVYLHNAHDYFLKFRLPHLRRKLTEAIKDDCPEDVTFAITKFFDEYVCEVDKHMMYEEKTVFPYVRDLLKGKKNPKYNISIFHRRHDQIESKITELKYLLLKYYPGKGGNWFNSALFDIFSTERDLATHNQIENNLFTPAILELEKQI